MKDLIIILIVAVVVCAVAVYIYRAKKSGRKCIGCPDGCSCSARENGGGCCGYRK